MKTIPAYFFSLIIATFFLSSCESKKQELRSSSPNGKSEIIISGVKSGLDPWILTIEIKKDGKSNKRETEMYADEINNQNVIITWEGDSACRLMLIEQDGTSRGLDFQL